VHTTVREFAEGAEGIEARQRVELASACHMEERVAAQRAGGEPHRHPVHGSAGGDDGHRHPFVTGRARDASAIRCERDGERDPRDEGQRQR
jgi:hypothetical protein